MDIQIIDERVFQLEELNTLILTGNPLKSIPAEISKTFLI